MLVESLGCRDCFDEKGNWIESGLPVFVDLYQGLEEIDCVYEILN